MRWLEKGLNRKFVTGTAAGLLASSLVFLVLYMNMYRHELGSERAQAAAHVNELLQSSLENSMLKRDLEGLRFVVRRLGAQSDIHSVFITNPRGEVRFASREALLGTQFPKQGNATQRREPETVFFDADDGTEVLRSINPVKNRTLCTECHGPVDVNPINGILYVDYKADVIKRKARDTTLILMGSGALIVILNLVGGWWFIRRFVIQPVDQLSGVSRQLTAGNLAARVAVKGQDEFAGLAAAFNEMADKLQRKIDELEQSRGFLQGVVDAIPDGVRILDLDGAISLTNKAYREQLGMQHATGVGDYCYASSHAKNRPCAPTLVTCPIHEIRQAARPLKAIHHHQRLDGESLAVEVYAAPMQVLVGGEEKTLVVESIRDLAKQVQYSQEQRLSELGRLATGVAHEIHNPLASMRMALNAADSSIDPDDRAMSEVRENIELVDREIDKCLRVTERLLKLSASPSKELELVELSDLLDDVLRLLQWEADNAGISLEWDYARGLRVLATDSEMRMLALNLAQNAFHAMPRGGTLRVTARRSGAHIQLAFEDTGVGIGGEDLQFIYDPFFSRRADGMKGTGLGLSIVRSIVEKHKGHIDVSTKKGQGTCFILQFPDADALAEATQ